MNLLSNSEFIKMWKRARNANEEDLIHSRFWTSDKDISLFNFTEGADPDFINKAFSAGLINNIYPAGNSKSTGGSPQDYKKLSKESIKGFR